MNKTSLLELAKKLNIPRRNCVKTKEELEEAIKGTIAGYKKNILVQVQIPLHGVSRRTLKAADH